MVVSGAGRAGPKVLGELVSIPTDGAPLDGLYYEPGDTPVAAALVMHGNGQNFYSGPARFLVPYLLRARVACLSFNRRGHDTISCRTRVPEGNAYQTTAEAKSDNLAARQFLADRGHGAAIVIGHSNGGLLAASHVVECPGARALVLLSAHCGGRELLARASALGLLAKDRVAEISEQAHRLVADGRPTELILLPGWWYATSAASLVDLEQNLPTLVDLAPEVTCPALVLLGDEDPLLYPAARFAELTGGPARFVAIEGADHFYAGHEDRVGELVSDWLEGVLATQPVTPRPRPGTTGANTEPRERMP